MAATAPVPALTQVAPDLHTATDLLRLPGGMRLPVRMTVVRQPDGGLIVHSPIQGHPALFAAVAALGPVAHIIAPSRIHHLYAGHWQAQFPGAALHGVPGLAEKRPDLRFTSVVGPEVTPAFAATLVPRFVAGAPTFNEVAFFHPPSRSLLVSDLFFNIRRPANTITRLMLSTTGTTGGLRVSRLWRWARKDAQALRASFDQVLGWDFARILPGHGDIAEGADLPAQARAWVDARLGK